MTPTFSSPPGSFKGGPPRRRVLVAALSFIAVCVWAGCTRPARVEQEVSASPYVGAQVCAECHSEIFNRQSDSPHARTLRAAEAGSAEFHDAERVRRRNPDNGQEYRLAERDGQWHQLRIRGGKEEASIPIQFLLGSGTHGVSPMTRDERGWRYLALTYYAHGGWDLSPMHGLAMSSLEDKAEDGWPVGPAELQKCWSCHSTRLEFNGSEVAAERSELGVRCESCHGPGRAHVEAARAKLPDLAIQNPSKWSSESFAALCQQCHNETATVEGTLMGISDNPADPKTVKYHVHGMKQSACFRKSGGEFSCITCHDPHGKSDPNPKFYEARCNNCHRPQTSGQKACSAGQTQNCLPCHMPKVEVAKYTQFADHWIRARSPFVSAARLAALRSHPTGAKTQRSSSRSSR